MATTTLVSGCSDERAISCLLIVVYSSGQFHSAVILLHRPFIFTRIPRHHSPTSRALPPNAIECCRESAKIICELLIMYRDRYGLRYIHCQLTHVTMTASLIHVYDCCFLPGNEGKQAQELLLICIRSFAEMGQSYKMASRFLEVVTSLRRDWQTELFTNLGIKRPYHRTPLLGRRDSAAANRYTNFITQ
jgi:hypothetical protein